MLKVLLKVFFVVFGFISYSSYAGHARQMAATYGKASANTVGVFKNCKVGIPCVIDISTNVMPSIRQCQYWDDPIPPLVRSWQRTEEARTLGIDVSGSITIFPGDKPGPVVLAVGDSYSSDNSWGVPSKCGKSESLWPIQGISVTFTRPIQVSDLPVRVIAMGRGRPTFIQGFETVALRDRAAVNIVIDGSLYNTSPDVFVPSCSVGGDAIIDFQRNTPDSIKEKQELSSPVLINCNGDVKANVSIKGGALISGRPENWTECGYGACELSVNGGSVFDIKKQKSIQFVSVWHSLGKPVQEGKFEGSAIASITYQ